MSLYVRPGYDHVENKAHELADEARRYNWTFDEMVKLLKSAWVTSHREAVSQAEYQVRQYRHGTDTGGGK